jgi:hypothetical protein
MNLIVFLYPGVAVLVFHELNNRAMPHFIDSGIESFILCCIGGIGTRSLKQGGEEWISCS